MKNDHKVFYFLLCLLLFILYTSNSKIIKNKGIVNFGNFQQDAFGCNINCRNNYPSSSFVNNDLISSGYYGNANISKEHVQNIIVGKTENLQTNHENIERKIKTGFGTLAENLILSPPSINDDVNIEKSDTDMRDISIDNWRKETEDKNFNSGVISDLREYQQRYNEQDLNSESNKFKKMSIEEHRKNNIKEWEKNVTERTTQSLNNNNNHFKM